MLDLFAIAQSNAGAVEAAFESVAAGLSSEQQILINEFAAWVEAETLISINVKLFVFVEFLNGRRYQNIYDWANEQSRLSGRGMDEALRERLHKFYDQRMTFDGSFKNGDQFCYGAMNAGTNGLPEYDPYCVVLTRSFQDSLGNAAWLPGDSLEICFAADGAFETTTVETRATPHERRHLMVATERATEVLSMVRSEWPSLIASGGRYFEVIFTGGVSLADVDCLRVSRSEYNRMWDMAFANFSRKLGDAERALVNDFVQMRRAVVDGRVRMEIYHDNKA